MAKSTLQGRPRTKTRQIGSSYSGIMEEIKLLIPQRYEQENADVMITDCPTIAMGVRAFTKACYSADWSIEAAPGALGDKYALIVEDMIREMTTNLAEAAAAACWFEFAGFSVLEQTLTIRDGKYYLDRLDERHPISVERFDVDDSGRLRGIWQQTKKGSVYIPRGKILHLTDGLTTSTPAGRGMFKDLKSSFEDYRYYMGLSQHMFVSDIRGVPIVRAPLAALEDKVRAGDISKSDMSAMLTRTFGPIQNRERTKESALLLDSQVYVAEETGAPSPQRIWDIDIIRGGADSAADIAAKIQEIKLDIARIMGTESFLIGDKGGSYALSENKMQIFYNSIKTCLSKFSEGFRTQILMPLFSLNGWPIEECPYLCMGSPIPKNASEIAAVLTSLETLPPKDPARDYVRGLVGAPVYDAFIEYSEDLEDDETQTVASDMEDDANAEDSSDEE